MKRSLILLAALLLILTGCGMESVIPEQKISTASFSDLSSLYRDAAAELAKIDYECTVSKTDLYRPSAVSDFVGFYILDIKNGTYSPYDGEAARALIETAGVKLIDKIRNKDTEVISFSHCVPGRNYDYGFYYCSDDRPVYLGDVTLTLTISGNGFAYEKKGALGVNMTYYTERVENNFFYYEIS
ncbi:MAG: hypothetical protein II776_07975 [Clostridia bacterium]|nr:hypothetical protein [Clostridia bacterium]